MKTKKKKKKKKKGKKKEEKRKKEKLSVSRTMAGGEVRFRIAGEYTIFLLFSLIFGFEARCGMAGGRARTANTMRIENRKYVPNIKKKKKKKGKVKMKQKKRCLACLSF
jgi:hypothetical protein